MICAMSSIMGYYVYRLNLTSIAMTAPSFTNDQALSSSKGLFRRHKGLAVEIGGTRRSDAVWSCWWIPVSRRLQLIDTARDGSTS